MRFCTNGSTVTASYYLQSPIYYNAGTAWVPQTNQVLGSANKSQYCTKLADALSQHNFAATGSGVVIEWVDADSTAFNAYNTTTLFNPPGGCYHAPEASQWYIWNNTKGSWINHTGASAASLNITTFSPFAWGDVLVFFANWQDYKATVTYNVNGGSITTGTGTKRYRVSNNIVQVSENSGSSWSNLSYSFGARTSYPDHWNVGTYGATRTGYTIVGTEAYGTTAAGGILINQDYSSSNTTNSATSYRMNGSVDLTANKNFTLYIHWKPNNYTVTLNNNGGTGGTGSVTATFGSNMPAITKPTRTGFAFMGYYDTNAATGGTQYYTATGASAKVWDKANNTTTLYARWNQEAFNITFELDQGEYQILPDKFPILENWDNFKINENDLLTMFKDSYFSAGQNGISTYAYNETGAGTNAQSTVNRVDFTRNHGDRPFTNSDYGLEITLSKGAYPIRSCRAGWVQTIHSAPNETYLHLFVAKVPEGYTITYASNSTGDNSKVTWLTSQQGTGSYEVYAYKRTCGSVGTFSTTGFVYIYSADAFNVKVYLAYSEVFNLSRTYTVQLPYNTLVTPPIPVKPGWKFLGWGRTGYGGYHMGNFGRGMMYTNKISIHMKGYMEDWAQYSIGLNNDQMRLISCTESGGWNIESGNGNIRVVCWDAGLQDYRIASSDKMWSSLKTGWHTFDIIFNGTNVKFYIDEELIATSPNFTNAPNGTIGYQSNLGNNIYVGAEATTSTPNASFFVGKITAPLILNTDIKTNINNVNFIVPAGNWSVFPQWIRENDIELKIKNLSGTTWYMNEIVDAYPNKNNFNIYLQIGNQNIKPNLWIEEGFIYDDDSNHDVYYDEDSGGWIDSSYRTWNFLNGKEINDSALIQWMYENGTLISSELIQWNQFPIYIYKKDLTNTTWYLNENIDVSTNFTIPLRFKTGNSDFTYDGIMSRNSQFGYGWLDPPYHFPEDLTFDDTAYENNAWTSSEYRELYIFNGEGTTNLNFINWLKNNGICVGGGYEGWYPIQIKTASQSSLNNLINSTWYFNEIIDDPSDYSYAKRDQYEWKINFTINNEPYSNLYNFEGSFMWSDTGDTFLYDYDEWVDESYRTITITSGEDIENPFFIDWLFNNATLISGGSNFIWS